MVVQINIIGTILIISVPLFALKELMDKIVLKIVLVTVRLIHFSLMILIIYVLVNVELLMVINIIKILMINTVYWTAL